MKALIVAGAATLVGVVGVAGLSTAMSDGSAAPAAAESTTRTTTTGGSLDDRIAGVVRAQRVADAALSRPVTTASRSVTTPAAPVAPLKRRGDGTIDDTQPGVRTSPGTSVKLRGDGSVDDDQASGRDRDRGDRGRDDRADDRRGGGDDDNRGRGGDDDRGDHHGGRGHGDDD